MNHPLLPVVLCAAVLLAGCQEQPSKNVGGTSDIEQGRSIDSREPPAAPTAPPSPPRSPTQASTTEPGENDGSPVITLAPLTADAARSETGARAMLLAWARGIELREFDQAWALMGDAAKAQTSKAAFNTLLSPLRGITVAVPGGTMEGAAGSSYYTAPATITGTRADGSKALLRGEVVLRRANDLPGATPEQLAWHIERIDLQPR